VASIKDLVGLNERGELGSLLCRLFDGQVGELQHKKGQEFIVEFEEVASNPTLLEVGVVVSNFYQSLGCMTKIFSSSDKFLDLMIHSSVKDEGLMTIVTTLISPAGLVGKKHLRVSTTMLGMPHSK